ncbi:hypothetical protein [uncultured Planococcus sp.]|uniref:hypothetical protein n=1 Tax=uncultured Planococcus sp. TaxID=337815 RepID=UPI0026354E83|nr:hypothetical protein [uncultured Planococcus sp.]
MALFAHTTTRYVLWSFIIFLLHLTGSLTIFTLLIISLLLVWSNYFFEKAGKEKELENKLFEWLWLPILVGTVAFVLYHYVF